MDTNMATLQDILNNRETYPDSQEIEMMGQKMTLGSLRADLIPKGDFTRATQKLSDDKARLESSQAQLQEAYNGLQAQLKTLVDARGQQPSQNGAMSDMDALAADPLLGPLVKTMQRIEQRIEADSKRYDVIQNTQKEMVTEYLKNEYRRKLSDMKRDHPDLSEPTLIDFATKHQIADLDLAYKLMTVDTRVEQTAREAEQRGYDKGKTEVQQVPPILPGRRMMGPPPTEGIKTLDEAERAAVNDPEIAKLFYEDGGAAPY